MGAALSLSVAHVARLPHESLAGGRRQASPRRSAKPVRLTDGRCDGLVSFISRDEEPSSAPGDKPSGTPGTTDSCNARST